MLRAGKKLFKLAKTNQINAIGVFLNMIGLLEGYLALFKPIVLSSIV